MKVVWDLNVWCWCEYEFWCVFFLSLFRPDTLDPALMRPGRMDRKVEFSLPDLEVCTCVHVCICVGGGGGRYVCVCGGGVRMCVHACVGYMRDLSKRK